VFSAMVNAHISALMLLMLNVNFLKQLETEISSAPKDKRV